MAFVIRPVVKPVIKITAEDFKKENLKKKGEAPKGTKSLPSDEYLPLFPNTEMELSDTLKIVFQCRRGGEYGLPLVDIRLFTDTPNYTGFTKKGFSMPADRLQEFIDKAYEVLDSIEDRKLLDEFFDEVPEDIQGEEDD